MYYDFKQQHHILLFILILSIFLPFLRVSGEDYLKIQITDNNDTKQKEIIARIGNMEISEDEFISSYEFGPAFVKRSHDSKSKHLKFMINEKLMALHAYQIKIDTMEQVREYYEAIKNDLMTEELFKEDILNKIEVAQSDIEKVVAQKQLEIELRWIYCSDKENIEKYILQLKSGFEFDSLYLSQFSDSVFVDERSLFTTRYSLGLRNPELAKIIDTLQIGSCSKAYNVGEGWYIFKIQNVRRNLISTESENEKLRNEAITAVKKNKMDIVSDKYVHALMLSHNPVIKRNVFNILRSYLGKFVLTGEKYSEWQLDEILSNTIRTNEINSLNINDQILVELETTGITLNDFLIWYRTRESYIKFNKSDITSYSKSLEQVIWRMIRDRLLTDLAYDRGFDQNENVREQLKWWRDKIVYSALKNDLVNSIILNEDEISNKMMPQQNMSENNINLEMELEAKIYRLLKELKETNQVFIDDLKLKNISVSSEEDPKAVDFYTVKRGGLIPRTPFPTIDFGWRAWE